MSSGEGVAGAGVGGASLEAAVSDPGLQRCLWRREGGGGTTRRRGPGGDRGDEGPGAAVVVSVEPGGAPWGPAGGAEGARRRVGETPEGAARPRRRRLAPLLRAGKTAGRGLRA